MLVLDTFTTHLNQNQLTLLTTESQADSNVWSTLANSEAMKKANILLEKANILLKKANILIARQISENIRFIVD
jgi:hypothetical protein